MASIGDLVPENVLATLRASKVARNAERNRERDLHPAGRAERVTQLFCNAKLKGTNMRCIKTPVAGGRCAQHGAVDILTRSISNSLDHRGDQQ